MKNNLKLLRDILRNWVAYKYSILSPVPVGYVIIGVTYFCNAKCKMCDIHQLYKDKPLLAKEELNFSLFLKRLKESKTISSIGHIDLTGGEPFIRDGLSDFIIELFKLPNIKLVTINTNGFLTEKIVRDTEHILRSIAQGKVFSISISIDAIGDAHDKIRGVSNAFTMVEKTVEALKKIKNKYSNFTLRSNAVIQEDNIDSLTEIKDYWIRHGIEGAYGLIQNTFYTCRTHLPENKNVFSAEAIEKIKRAAPKSKGMNHYLDHGFSRPLPCFAGYSAMFLDQWGAIYPCNFLAGNQAYVMGNIKKEAIDAIWESRNAWDIRGKIKKCPYTNCWNGCEVDQTIIQFEPIERIVKMLSLGAFSYYRHLGLCDFI
jgi:radical SAM protein with 4Fe4S-binding SPASM domain